MKHLKFFEEFTPDFTDFLNAEITVDTHVNNPEKLASIIHSILDNFEKFKSTFKIEYKSFHIEYSTFISNYGKYPTNINIRLISSIRRINRILDFALGGMLIKNEKEKETFEETQKLIIEMVRQYYEFQDDVNKYNL
jgi:hypothetical protein